MKKTFALAASLLFLGCSFTGTTDVDTGADPGEDAGLQMDADLEVGEE